MESISTAALMDFLEQLGLRYSLPAKLYLLDLSKIARGFEPDLEDVLYWLEQGLIEFGELEKHFKSILPVVQQADIIPSEFRAYFETLRSQWINRPSS